MEKPGNMAFSRTVYIIAFVALAAALVFGLMAYFGARSAIAAGGSMSAGGNAGQAAGGSAGEQAPGSQGSSPASQGSAATGSGGEAQVPNANATKAKEVTLDFLYADWCPHCQKMKPIVASLAAKLPPDRFELRYYNEALRATNATIAAVYGDYEAKGYFRAYPTFVLNWDTYNVGEMSEQDFDAWVCAKFNAPKPAACAN